MSHIAVCRSPFGEVRLPPTREVTERWLVDAAYFPGGRADAVYAPRTEGEVAAVLSAHATVLPLGAQSSLTGGATPMGGALIATDAMATLEIDAAERIARCGAGVALVTLQERARDAGLFLAPAPTYDGAFVGGAVATNAAGAATFKYGTMRRAVIGLTVVLADGGVLDLVRGDVTAHADGYFEIQRRDGRVARVPVPSYRDPEVPKCSAGYFADEGMDLVDLFVGSEGTLGVVIGAELELIRRPEASLLCWLPMRNEGAGLDLVGRLRETSRATWASADPTGVDIPSIEHFDRRCIELLIADGAHKQHNVPLDATDALVLLFSLEIHRPLGADEALEELFDPKGPDTPLRRLVTLLGAHAERLEAALPGEQSKVERFRAMREAVPMTVNHRIRDLRATEPEVHKIAGDFIVPFDRLGEAFAAYRGAFNARGLDHAIWGHIGDGNVHPNVVPRSAADVTAGKEALLELGEMVVRMGGSPLAEHGVGRHPVKQAHLRALRGESGVAEMRAVKEALDPDARLAPGVLFPADPVRVWPGP